MPIIKSAIKRSKQAKVRTARNLSTKRAVRTEVKSVEVAVNAKNGKEAAAALIRAQSALDTAVKKNIIHKNKAARKKSQLNKLVKTVAGSTPSKSAVKKTPTKKPAAKKAPAKKVAKKPAAKKKAASK